MPPLVIAAAVIGGATVGAAAISLSAQKKAAKNVEELAREQQNTAIAEQRRLEEKYGLTPGELAREQRLLGIPEGEQAIKFASTGIEERRGTELERKAGLTGEELLRETGPETRRLLDEIAARQGKTGEELFREEGGDLGKILSEQAVSGKPTEMFEPELELTRQMVNAEANRRGVFGGLPEGGIRFENLGRAGVDLAIKSARERLNQQNALVNAYLSLKSGARGEAGTVAERALTSKERASTELAQFLQDLQSQSAASKGRAASAGLGAAQITQPSVSQGYQNLIGIEGYKGGIVGPAEAGLGALGDIGSAYLLANLPSSKTTPTTLEGEREAGFRYDPEQGLGGITGAEFIKKRKSEYSLLS